MRPVISTWDTETADSEALTHKKNYNGVCYWAKYIGTHGERHHVRLGAKDEAIQYKVRHWQD